MLQTWFKQFFSCTNSDIISDEPLEGWIHIKEVETKTYQYLHNYYERNLTILANLRKLIIQPFEGKLTLRYVCVYIYIP